MHIDYFGMKWCIQCYKRAVSLENHLTLSNLRQDVCRYYTTTVHKIISNKAKNRSTFYLIINPFQFPTRFPAYFEYCLEEKRNVELTRRQLDTNPHFHTYLTVRKMTLICWKQGIILLENIFQLRNSIKSDDVLNISMIRLWTWVTVILNINQLTFYKQKLRELFNDYLIKTVNWFISE